MSRLTDVETRKRLGAAKITSALSWRKLAVAWGYPPSFAATLSRVYRGGHVAIETENEIRKHLNLSPLPITAPAPVCPTCGVVHAVGDCGGVPGQPVILPPDARIVKPKRKRPAPPAWVDRAADNLQTLLNSRRPPEPFQYSRAWWRKQAK